LFLISLGCSVEVTKASVHIRADGSCSCLSTTIKVALAWIFFARHSSRNNLCFLTLSFVLNWSFTILLILIWKRYLPSFNSCNWSFLLWSWLCNFWRRRILNLFRRQQRQYIILRLNHICKVLLLHTIPLVVICYGLAECILWLLWWLWGTILCIHWWVISLHRRRIVRCLRSLTFWYYVSLFLPQALDYAVVSFVLIWRWHCLLALLHLDINLLTSSILDVIWRLNVERTIIFMLLSLGIASPSAHCVAILILVYNPLTYGLYHGWVRYTWVCDGLLPRTFDQVNWLIAVGFCRRNVIILSLILLQLLLILIVCWDASCLASLTFHSHCMLVVRRAYIADLVGLLSRFTLLVSLLELILNYGHSLGSELLFWILRCSLKVILLESFLITYRSTVYFLLIVCISLNSILLWWTVFNILIYLN